MLRYGYRGKHRFRLRDALLKASPLGLVHDGVAYSSCAIPEVDLRQITYYASSIFWRTSVYSCQQREHHISLGPLYEEQFRTYLLGSDDFPTNAALVVQVANSENPLNVFAFPFSQRHSAGYHQHSFLAQGILFWLFVGSRFLPDIKRICIVRSPEKLIFLSDRIDAMAESAAIELMASTVTTRLESGT